MIAGTQLAVRQMARRLTTNAALAEELFQIGMEVVCKRAAEQEPQNADAFLIRHNERIRGAMLDVLRAQGKARRIDLEMHKVVAPVLVVSEVGDMFAPPEVRAAHQREANNAVAAAAALVLFRPDLAESAEELYEQRESRLKLEAALATVTPTLDPHEWELTRRHFIEGVTLEALAQEHGVSVSTVSRRIDKTLKELGKKLKQLKIGKKQA